MHSRLSLTALVSLVALGLLTTGFARFPRPNTPEVFLPGLVSTEQEEYHVTFSPGGRLMLWARGEVFFPFSRQATIVSSEWRDGRWTPAQVAPFSGQYSDLDPAFSPDGRYLFFSSSRPVNGVPREDVDLWVVERTRHGWGEPRHLGDAVNSPGDELYPSVDAEGTLYFGSDRDFASSGFDIYRAERRADGNYGPAESIGAPINTAAWEFNPSITPDGRTLLFTNIGRPDNFGFGDLYVSKLGRNGWSEPRNLGPVVNTELDEYHPWLSPDCKELFFVRHSYTPYIEGDVYAIKASSVGLHLKCSNRWDDDREDDRERGGDDRHEHSDD
jgi:WD40-like Beta Propeller Repeat